jgi:hypothetical protein
MIRFACILAVVAACSGRDDHTVAPAAAAQLENRPDHVVGANVIPMSHDAPAGRASEIRALFESGAMSYPIAVVSEAGVQTQFVNPKPVFVGENRFVIGAPPNVHKAIDELMARMGKRDAPASSTYELTYWIVDAATADKTEVPADLAEAGLDKLTGLGARKFHLIDRVSARTRDGSKAKITGRLTRIEQRVATGPDGIELDLMLQLQADKPGEPLPTVETTLQVPIDRPIVVGDSSTATATNLLLYVVRARRVE